MPSSIANDPISVLVAFRGGTVKPWKFRWGNRMFEVKRVNLIHGSREGRSRVFTFSCSDDANFWKLRFDTESLEWRLVEYATE
ncbi:hypothetical protein A3F28_01860 [Candidatus Uhrbacteria bacterium RIFCSPHIGHO2_12_FULL_57_11]|uniref:Uncharacterized protein n=2 Tax=Candidatus Uhriibacteriota TaxID=1752732 RepID=A0A1F7UM72_9BACT|nr:MAG: hypothetical protein A3D72_02825 [Candidatus Uhrbacteria bacterium RIFCSPHIGHO2_02_FULL_57_19]OGL79393.1 MAG: hypothetical protein A3F28_01860 [Candidatus Uhrbacteria bacterium RIFCSPHIGHO2_12_FULL_57_11]